MAAWGDDKPILTTDNDQTKKGRGASDKDSFNMIGSVCSKCGGVDADHENICPNTN